MSRPTQQGSRESACEPHWTHAPHQTAPEVRHAPRLDATGESFTPGRCGTPHRCRARLPRLLTLAGVLCWALASPRAWAQLVNPGGSDEAAYRNVKSYVDRTPADLMAAIPDLKGLVPASKEEADKALPLILGRVGENEQRFYEKFPNTTSREEITLERLDPDGKVDSVRQETFQYLALSSVEHGVSTLREYRTDATGKPVEPTGLEEGLAVTRGFVYLSVYFHPAVRSDAFFRYLGTQKVDGKEADVVAFAQRPGWAQVGIEANVAGRAVLLLVQGLAWIDPVSYQILRMRLDLLAPRPEVGLTGETTEITFGKVSFPEMPGTILWLPREVTVTMQWEGRVKVRKTTTALESRAKVDLVSTKWEHRTYRNIHRYSDYKLFSSKSKLTF